MASADGLQPIITAEHIGPTSTGDNVEAKRVVAYGFDGANWQRTPTALLDVAYDYVGMSSPDANGNYTVFTYKQGGSGGTIVRTLTYTYDVSSNVTSITRS